MHRTLVTQSMKKQVFISLFPIIFTCIGAASIHGQQANGKTAYVPDATTSSSVPQDDQRLNKRLADAAVVFLEMRLNSLKDLHVERSKSPCADRGMSFAGREQTRLDPKPQPQNRPVESNNTPDSFEINTEVKTLKVSGVNEGVKELVLDYELIKYVRCTAISLVHRSAPISEKTAFDGFLQMGDVLEVKLRNELAPPKTTIDVGDISVQSEALQPIKDGLLSQLFIRLASETDFTVRDIRGAQPTQDADYIVTGVLTKDKKGVDFTIKNVKDNSKSSTPFVPSPTDQKNKEALDAFYAKAAETVVNYIRICPSTPLTDDQIQTMTKQVAELLCKEPCQPKPLDAILLLMRLSCAGKDTPATLTLLGDAYIASDNFLQAADAYDRAWKMLSPDRTDEIVQTVILAGDAWYRAQSYGNAAERYELAIAKSPELQPPQEAVYLQRTRSYRFAGDSQRGFAAALDGLAKYPTSAQLAEERKLIAENLANILLDQAFDPATKRNVNELERLLKQLDKLPLASLSEEVQDGYKIMRAVWLSDAKNDFENAISMLSSVSQSKSDVKQVAQYCLADTYYQKARRTSNKGDYEKAVPLYKDLAAAGLDLIFDDLYAHFMIANHELGRDQDTRSFLEDLLVKTSDTRIGELIVTLCINYSRDLECADKTIQHFEASPFPQAFQVWELELHVLRAEYPQAEKLVSDLLSSAEKKEVTLFYQVWTLFALNREKDAQAGFRLWQDQMETVRAASNTVRPPGNNGHWVFEAANRALDTETKLSTAHKEKLRSMITAMTDQTRPLPK